MRKGIGQTVFRKYTCDQFSNINEPFTFIQAISVIQCHENCFEADYCEEFLITMTESTLQNTN